MDDLFLDISLQFMNIFFFIISITGIVLSIVLFFSPQKISNIEKVLNRKFHVDSRGVFVDTRVDIEHIFYNNHIVTAIIMIASSLLLLYLNRAVDLESMQISKWIILFAFLKYFLNFSGCLGGLFGLFMLISPRNAFLLLRWLNKYVCTLSTDDVDAFLEIEIIEKKIYLKNHFLCAVILFLFSIALFALLSRQMFF